MATHTDWARNNQTGVYRMAVGSTDAVYIRPTLDGDRWDVSASWGDTYSGAMALVQAMTIGERMAEQH